MEKLCECGCGNPAPIAKQTRECKGHVAGQPVRFIQGHHTKTHGWNYTPEYAAWNAAKHRCTNPHNKQWKDYGGRGIKFLFTSFEQFIAELGPRPSPQHSLDRKNNDGNYEHGNVRWATKAEQLGNRRNTLKKAA